MLKIMQKYIFKLYYIIPQKMNFFYVLKTRKSFSVIITFLYAQKNIQVRAIHFGPLIYFSMWYVCVRARSTA